MYSIPKALFENLKKYLQKREDFEAKTLLNDLETQGKTAYITPNGTHILGYNSGGKYRVD